MGPGVLARALCGIEWPHDENLLVGLERADDAGVYRLDAERALIQTVDFFTPVVDDPETFGRIAAANSLSDVYAMGGRPICALNLIGFPIQQLDPVVLRAVLRGGAAVLTEAGVSLAGGHSVDNPQLLYGLAVSGLVHPERIWKKGGARPGDALVLTKPLGTGIVTTALKAGQASAAAVAAAVASMERLNRAAAECAAAFAVHAATDVTGFGLLGHAAEMLEGEPVGFAFEAAALPLLPGLEEYAGLGLRPGGLMRNRDFRSPMVEVAPSVHAHLVDAAYDPQTSGGLLLAVPADQASALVERLRAADCPEAAAVGRVSAEHPGRIRLV